MDQLDNPYMNMIEIMRTQGSTNNPIPFLIGKVISVEPLLIQTESIQLEREDVLINSNLLRGYNPDINRPGVDDQASTDVDSGISENIGYEFLVNDSVVLLVSADQQKYILLCRVVQL